MRATVMAASLMVLGFSAPVAAAGCACDARCSELQTLQVGEPRLAQLQAIVLGAGTGFGLGLALRERPAPDQRVALAGWKRADGFVLGGAAALYLAPGLLGRHQEPDLLKGRWSDCSNPKRGKPADRLNGFDRSVRGWLSGGERDVRRLERRRLYDRLSYTTLFASIALPVGASQRRSERDLLVTVEAVGVAGAATAALKHVFHRPRPFVHFCAAAERAELCEPDAQLSFFSGHTAMSFAGAVTAGRLADFRGSRDRRRIWATGLTLATSTGLLRIAADKHYATDVLGGLVVGGLAGWFVPKLHRPSVPTLGESPASVGPPAVAPLVSLPLRMPGLGARAQLSAGLAGGGPALAIRAQW